MRSDITLECRVDRDTNHTRASLALDALRVIVRTRLRGQNGFDLSHDSAHCERVERLANELLEDDVLSEWVPLPGTVERDEFEFVVSAAALLHDYNDHKYTGRFVEPSEEYRGSMIRNGIPASLVDRVEIICDNVSWSKECAAGPSEMEKVLATHPELRYVQDADRLDALGPIGIIRAASYSGRTLADFPALMDVLKNRTMQLCGKMKTVSGVRRSHVLTVWTDQFVRALDSQIEG